MAKLEDLPRLIKNLLEREVILEEGAKSIRRAIPARTRRGKGVRENLGNEHPLPGLAPATKKIRRKLQKAGKLTGAGATPEKSTFTRSGDSLDNLQVNVSRGQIDVTLDTPDQHKLNDSLQINKDYQFMRLSKKEFNRVLKAISESMVRAIKKITITDL